VNDCFVESGVMMMINGSELERCQAKGKKRSRSGISMDLYS
jgi:hypothetical protein